LIDIKPDKVVPTWRNGRSGQEAIAHRLDRFLVAEDLLIDIGIYRSWVEFPYVSDHAPILLQMELPPAYKIYPFKFNEHWIHEKEFVDLVVKVWKDPIFLSEGGRQLRVIRKLQELKKQTKIWHKQFQIRKKAKLVSLESGIKEKIKILSGIQVIRQLLQISGF
jgi:hypothetical protein